MNYYLLCSYVVVAGQFQQVDALGGVGHGDDALFVAEPCAADHTAVQVDDLEQSLAVDDEVAVVREGERFGVFGAVVLVDAGVCEHHPEARPVVAARSGEGVGVAGQHVDVAAGDVVDEVEEGEVGVGRAPSHRVVAILAAVEMQRELVRRLVKVEDGIVLAGVAEIDLTRAADVLHLGGAFELRASELDDGDISGAIRSDSLEVDQRVGRTLSAEMGAAGGLDRAHAFIKCCRGCRTGLHDEESLVDVDVSRRGIRT